MKLNYVVGFAFNKEKNKVLLIKKIKPAWQNGLLNGIGGKIENYDITPYHSMTREFLEESNIKTSEEEWYYFSKLDSDDFELNCFVGFFDDDLLNSFESITDEQVTLVSVQELFDNQFNGCISNLKWLISICLDNDLYRIFIEGKYSS